jgi:hypothetical protein
MAERVGEDDGTHYSRPHQGNPENGMPAGPIELGTTLHNMIVVEFKHKH